MAAADGVMKRALLSLVGLLLVTLAARMARPRLHKGSGLRGIKRALQTRNETTREVIVILNLLLEYVDDELSNEFQQQTNSVAVEHFCDAINEQAGGNQVEDVAEELGVSVQTTVVGTLDEPDYQCSIVKATPVPGSVTDDGLHSLRVLVEQVVYVTANRTLSTSEVKEVVENGFNRGRGGRVKFRSLLRTHFPTIENVEVLNGSLTGIPTEVPSVNPSVRPTDLPSASPVGKAILQSHVPTSRSSAQPSAFPSEKPNMERPNPMDEVILGDNNELPKDVWPGPLTILAIVGGLIVLLIATIFSFLCVRRHVGQKKQQKKKSETWGGPKGEKKEKNKESEDAERLVPELVQLNEENRSLANTTLGDQTAGGFRIILSQKAGQAIPNGRLLSSFDESSLYTSNVAAHSGFGQSFGVSKKLGTAEDDGATYSNLLPLSVSNSILPPSIMPFEDECIIHPESNVESPSMSSGSSAFESSLLSVSVTSSSFATSSGAYQGRIDLDGSEFDVTDHKENDADPFLDKDLIDFKTKVPRTLPVSPFEAEKTTVVREMADPKMQKSSSHQSEPENRKRSLARRERAKLVSTLAPLDLAGTSKLRRRFESENRHRSTRRGGSSSYHSLDGDAAPSVASSTLTRKAANLFNHGAQVSSNSRRSDQNHAMEEEEKKEIDSLTSDDGNGFHGSMYQGSNRDDPRVPMPLDLLADHQLLERSTSPSSFSSWKVSHEVIIPFTKEKDEGEVELMNTGHGTSNFSDQELNINPFHAGEGFPTRNHVAIHDAAGESKFDSMDAKQEDTSSEEEQLLTPALSCVDPLMDGNGILGVHPRKDAITLENGSASSSSTGLSNPWLFEAVEQTLGPRSSTADIESLSGRSNRSAKSNASNRSDRSHKSHRSQKSNRSYNVHPTTYKESARGRIRSSAASVASYGGSSFERKSMDTSLAPRTLEHDLTRLEMQLAALQRESDQVTASSITLSSIGGKSRSTLSSKLTHTGANLIRKKRVIIELPPGKLGVVLANRHDGRGTIVSEVRANSVLRGMLSPGDKLVAIDGENVEGMGVNEITQIMSAKHDTERLLTVITSTHHEARSVGTM